MRSNHDGITVPPDDVSALAKAIEALLRDSSFRDQIGKNAIKTAHERYDIKQHAKDLLMIYTELIDGKR